jgi:RNA polymerase sigma factor (TIGR02999 family)
MMAATPIAEISLLIAQYRDGDHAAGDRLLPLVYPDLRRAAARLLARQAGPLSVDAGDVLHDAWLRLAPSTGTRARFRATSRTHLLALATTAMRCVLIDRARRRNAEKRGGATRLVSLDGAHAAPPTTDSDRASLFDALDRLGRHLPRLRRVAELRYLHGRSDDEIAAEIGVTARTVQRDWVKARAWLHRELCAVQPGTRT